MIETSIIIRARNEGTWIGSCLEAIYQQKYKNSFEIILVNNHSTDNTLKISKFYNTRVVNYKSKIFNYSKSLNIGCSNANGKYLVFISAHCIPSNTKWLESLIKPLKSKNIVGVYGKQIPTKFSNLLDRRDLINTFKNEKIIQKNDFFFHNANSSIKKNIWEKYKFDENINGLEDRYWAKRILINKVGYICYNPLSVVFHEHGLNQGMELKRAKRIDNLLNGIYDI